MLKSSVIPDVSRQEMLEYLKKLTCDPDQKRRATELLLKFSQYWGDIGYKAMFLWVGVSGARAGVGTQQNPYLGCRQGLPMCSASIPDVRHSRDEYTHTSETLETSGGTSDDLEVLSSPSNDVEVLSETGEDLDATPRANYQMEVLSKTSENTATTPGTPQWTTCRTSRPNGITCLNLCKL